MASIYDYYKDLCSCPGFANSGAGDEESIYDFYKKYCVCPPGMFDLGMQDLAGHETNSYPVTVYNVNVVAIGVAANKADYISIWNSDSDNQAIGILGSGNGAFRFRLQLNPGQISPGYVIGEPEDGNMDLGIYAIEYAVEYE